MKKIKKEFEDLMLTKTEGRMIEQLMVKITHPLPRRLTLPGVLSYFTQYSRYVTTSWARLCPLYTVPKL